MDVQSMYSIPRTDEHAIEDFYLRQIKRWEGVCDGESGRQCAGQKRVQEQEEEKTVNCCWRGGCSGWSAGCGQ